MLMNERGRLERVTRRFIVHLLCGERAKFLIPEWKQFVSSFGIAAFDGVQEAGHVAHTV